MLRPPHSAEKGMGDDGMLCAECSGERARATTACSAQSAQGRTSHRIGNGAEVGCVDRSTGISLDVVDDGNRAIIHGSLPQSLNRLHHLSKKHHHEHHHS
uniref:Uncharacterized protein n=1 Tax=Oryza nivara TaxID=4536 RepID=A0A0E0JCI2_ORYNI